MVVEGEPSRARFRRAWAVALAPGVTAVAAALLFAATVVLPYLVNGLHHLPIEEVASGMHDPKDYWPLTGGAAGTWMHLLGVFSLLATPAVLLAVVIVGAGAAPFGLRVLSPGGRVTYLTGVVVATAMLVAYFTPLPLQLGRWMLD